MVLGDYNYDGYFDFFLMYDKFEGGGWWGLKVERLGMGVYLGGGFDGGFCKF